MYTIHTILTDRQPNPWYAVTSHTINRRFEFAQAYGETQEAAFQYVTALLPEADANGEPTTYRMVTCTRKEAA